LALAGPLRSPPFGALLVLRQQPLARVRSQQLVELDDDVPRLVVVEPTVAEPVER
jgi:hypothetical protein